MLGWQDGGRGLVSLPRRRRADGQQQVGGLVGNYAYDVFHNISHNASTGSGDNMGRGERRWKRQRT